MRIEVIERLLEFATSAPSGDNAQPWRFTFDPEERSLAIGIEESRVDSPKAMWRFIARLSVGAALENLIRAAPCLGLDATLVEPRPGEAARVALQRSPGSAVPPDELALLERRTTNRKAYDGSAVPSGTAARLRDSTPSRCGVSTHWILDRARIEAMAELMFRMDATMYGVRAIWKSIEGRIRFDRPWDDEVGLGLSQGSLEQPRLKLWTIRNLGGLPHSWLRGIGLVSAFSRRTRALVRSASGVCYLVSEDSRAEADVRAGRLLQRAWLALAGEGYATHPMNTIALMEHVLAHGEPEIRSCVEATPMPRWIREFKALVPGAGERRSVFLMRFGRAPTPTIRNGRLPVPSVLSVCTGATSRRA